MPSSDGEHPPESQGPVGLPEITTHPHSLTVVEREGYRELRCHPTTWTYDSATALPALLAEYYSCRMGVDPHGLGGQDSAWSGSDAALRLQMLPRDDLVQRELTALASRRSVGLNAPTPWAARSAVKKWAEAWEPEARNLHVSQVPLRDRQAPHVWNHYGMQLRPGGGTITGYYTMNAEARCTGDAHQPWRGARGCWYAWSVLERLERWPRRQDAGDLARSADRGNLLLFVSHRWETADHPDPSGRQLEALRVGLLLSLAASLLPRDEDVPAGFVSGSGLPEVFAQYLATGIDLDPRSRHLLGTWAQQVRRAATMAADEAELHEELAAMDLDAAEPALAEIRERVLVWYDYASMLQEPRSEQEEAAFEQELLQLNAIQAAAATVVLGGDSQFLERAWCFLELCGGMRSLVTELTPSWGHTVGIGASPTRWSSRSDQLIGALRALGPQGIARSGLETTRPKDLPSIARLVGQLPLMGLVESDDSDLLGGGIPIPFRSGTWSVAPGSVAPRIARELTVDPLPDPGRVSLVGRPELGLEGSPPPQLRGEVGMWIYSTQRVLAWSWMTRFREIWDHLRRQLSDCSGAVEQSLLACDAAPSVSCLWADARALADDGEGWTSYVPSEVRLLVIVTQADLASVCRITDRVIRDHLANGVPVVVVTPFTGLVQIYEVEAVGAETRQIEADLLAVPRLRRSTACDRNVMLPKGVSESDVEVLAALRLEPSLGPVPKDQRTPEASGPGLGEAGEPIERAELLSMAPDRARVEGLARGSAGTWDTWCTPRLHQPAWSVGMARVQLHVIETLLRMAAEFSNNPMRRRRLLDVIVEEHHGYALPPGLENEMKALAAWILAAEADRGAGASERERRGGRDGPGEGSSM